MKKSILAAAVAVMLGISASDALAAKYTEPKQLDKYLYEMTYTDYDYAEYQAAIKKVIKMPKFGCSGVHNGNYFGRNFDFFYNDLPQYVIHVPKAKGRYASMGVGYCFDMKLKKDMTEEEWQMLPWTMLDGVNEKGVGCSINVCPVDDLQFYMPEEGTKPGKEEVDIVTVVRYVLDRAKSAKHGVELLQNANIVDYFIKTPLARGSGCSLHMMICDSKNNYVVEVVDGKVQYAEDNVMTNFYNTFLPTYTTHAMGVERYAILKENHAIGGKSMEGMKELMQKATYSFAYNPEYRPVRYSDFFVGHKDETGKEITLEMLNGEEKYRKVAMDYLKHLKFERNNPAIWITTSTSVYDLKNKKFNLFIQEDYDKCYSFELKKK